MNPKDRQTEIINIIREYGRILVDELATSLHTSKETIRRDLTELARIGKVQKFHGGATLPINTGEGPFRERMSENTAAKISIGAVAAKLFSPGETIFIDTGSTTLYFAEKLAEIPNLTVVTNSAEIARIIGLKTSSDRTFMLGGKFNVDNRQTVGSMAVEQLSSFHAHHAVLTIGALDAKNGVMDFSIEETEVAQAMIKQAESVTVLADSSKLDKIASFEVCRLKHITNLVCDTAPSGELKEALHLAEVKVFTAGQ